MKKKMIIVGLTGSIGMGKSTAARMLKNMGLPVYDADKVVHALLEKNGKAFKPISRLFPLSCKRGVVNRRILGQLVFGHPLELKKLEKILHPLVRKEEAAFLKKARQDKLPLVILDIPLLFETGGEERCDVTVCVTAPRAVQKARVLKRKNMTEQKFRTILKEQMPDAQKRKRADYVVKTGLSTADTKKQLLKIIKELHA